ncbi:hypothetical protein ACFU9F_02085 [Streptomyces zhihengii]|uniref:Uncharacterized protein n=1 Tax=Streptomyces zhihengii TaxID=1818004 RepID=A0ABS2V448_9ACTN|nr:hypothetical protein [Streptomyces zhihengii]MBM9624249.1 hypothetical protein [Streptomyces zhihengii]
MHRFAPWHDDLRDVLGAVRDAADRLSDALGPRASAADEETHPLPTDGSRFTQEKRDCFSLAP